VSLANQPEVRIPPEEKVSALAQQKQRGHHRQQLERKAAVHIPPASGTAYLPKE
jgi:hypothetical protein